ncbi:MAG: PLDc N-terminal domain-containing protein [Candidatus Hodarchaeales archaeon]|jgi:hypothetical protein
MNESEIVRILTILVPVVLLQVTLQIFSLWHLWKRSHNDKKPLFAVLMVVLSFIGVIIYWIAGSESYAEKDVAIEEKGAF